MLTLFRDGGFSMFFVLGFGFVSLGWAAWYAAMGKAKPLAFVRSMMLATLFSIASGTWSDLGTVFKFLAEAPETGSDAAHAAWDNKVHMVRLMIEGVGESMAPGIMGFSLLALTALLLAVGAARLPSAERPAP
jgi:hypothetical protein